MKKRTVVVLAFCGASVLPACRAGARSAEQSASPAERTSKSSNPEVRLDPSQLKQVRIEELSTFAPADVIKRPAPLNSMPIEWPGFCRQFRARYKTWA